MVAPSTARWSAAGWSAAGQRVQPMPSTQRRALQQSAPALSCAAADRFDLEQQIAPADVSLQVDRRRLLPQRLTQLAFDSRLIFDASYVDLADEIAQRKAFLAQSTVRGFDDRGDVAQCFAGLFDRITCVCGLVTDDAGGAGNEESLGAIALDTRPRECRTARSVLRGVGPGAALAWILERDRRAGTGDAIERQR